MEDYLDYIAMTLHILIRICNDFVSFGYYSTIMVDNFPLYMHDIWTINLTDKLEGTFDI
jgi:hypothetical protein